MISSNRVEDINHDLPNKESTSFDNIPVSLLKAVKSNISPVIANVINQNIEIETSIFPRELLSCRLKLIHQGGDNDIENFRGITIPPSLSKVIERWLTDELTKYLEQMNFFNQNQFGFKKHSSCFSTVLQAINKIKTSAVKKKFSAAFFIDLRKPFDIIDKLVSLKVRQT